MCGRFRELAPAYQERLGEELGVEWRGESPPQRFEVRPTDYARVVLAEDGGRVGEMFRWGLIPSWAKEIAKPPFNARVETVHSNGMFRGAYRAGRRCLVPMEGLWEWPVVGGKKVRTWVQAPDGGPLCAAGLWEEWRPRDAEPVRSFTILTCEPSDWFSSIHNRMAVLLDREGQEAWLDPSIPTDRLHSVLRPYGGGLVASPEA